MSRSSIYRVLVIAAVSLGTVAFHYGVFVGSPENGSAWFHAVHGRLCYIPIILGAIWFGVRGGLAVSLAISAATVPYALLGPHAGHSGAVSEYTEMVFYVFIGLTAGVLIELQRRERRRREALARELTRKKHLASLGEMAAGLAHEIKNPLGSIKGSAEILGDDFDEGSRNYELITVLSKETDRLDRVVNDFLSFARPRPIERTPVAINSLLDEVISQIQIDSRAHKIHVVRRFDPAVPTAPFDSAKLHQVFLNIALNALAAMPDGGTLAVATEATSREGRREIVASFTDDGRGIAPEDAERIFDPFFTTSDNGTGLGLSISHTIVQNHGGRIEVTPRKRGGTRIAVVLPVVEEN